MLFDWDESKRQANLAKHLVDFQDATQIFDGPVFEQARRRHGEDRVLAIGLMEDVEIVVVLRYARQTPAYYVRHWCTWPCKARLYKPPHELGRAGLRACSG